MPNRRELLYGILGLFFGLVLMDSDHVLPIAIFHWFPIIIFMLFFSIGLLVFKENKP